MTNNPPQVPRPNELSVKIKRLLGRGIADYNLINDGDRILVAVSGGKDSLAMLHFLKEMQKKAPVKFELKAVNVDQGQPGFPDEVLPKLFAEWKCDFHIEKQDTYSIVLDKTPEGKTYCAVCSRMRRGILYRLCREFGYNKLALGHHRDDLLQTFLLNGFFAGKLSSMPPKYTNEDGDIEIIRPLFAVPEEWIKQFVTAQGWPIVPCNLCGTQDGLKRREVDKLLENLEAGHPGIKDSFFAALSNVHAERLLDKSLYSS